MIGVGGLVTSIIAFGVGAILDFAIIISPYQHGLNLNKVGMILMIIGALGAVVSVIVMVLASVSRRRTVVDDGAGECSATGGYNHQLTQRIGHSYANRCCFS